MGDGKAVRVASSSTDLVQVSVFPNLTSIFKISFDVVRSAGSVRLRAGTLNTPYVNATDTYTYYVTPTSNDQLKFQADSSNPMSNTPTSQFSQAHCLGEDLATALPKAASQLKLPPDQTIDLLFAFAAGYSPEEFDLNMPSLQKLTGAKHVVGCSCEATIGGGLEFENEKSLSLWAACLPNSKITPLHLQFTRSGGESAITGWPDDLTHHWPEDCCLIGLNEPFEFPVDLFSRHVNRADIFRGHESFAVPGGSAEDSVFIHSD